MKTAALITACLVGPLAFGLLFAGFVQLVMPTKSNQNPPKRATPGVVLGIFLDAILLQGAITSLIAATANWPNMPEARRLIYVGMLCGLVTLTAAFLSR